MFHATGAIDGIAYSLTWQREEPHLSGSPGVMAILEQEVGESHLATPVGPLYTLDLADDASVLACLVEMTLVTETAGQVPDLTPPSVRHPSGAVPDA